MYIRISDQPYAYGEDLDPQRRIDYAEDGTPIGVELLCVSTGLDLRYLPLSPDVAKLFLASR